MQYSQKYNVCVYPLKDHAQAVACTKGYFKLPDDQVAVPCTLHNMQIMAALGYEAISPIVFEYDWPIVPGRQPLEHQKHMASFMTLHPRCFNLSDMGTMKTLATLWAWDYLMLKGEVKQVIIDCTMSCMDDVWQREIMKNFLSRRKAVIVHGSRAKRVERLQEKADFYIINHDGLDIGSKHPEGGKFQPGPLAEYLKLNPDINGVSVDEGGAFRHQSTDMYKSLKHALRDKPYFNWLTGTPTPKDPTDAYAQAKMVRLDYNENFTTFRERTMYKAGPFAWKAKPDGYDIAASVLKPAIRYDREASGIKLPPLVTEDRTTDLSPAQAKAIKELKGTLKTMVAGGTITALNEASLRIKLLQICCGAVYGEGKKVLKVDCANRLKLVEEVIEQSTAKIIIFTSFTNVVDMLYSELSKHYTVEKVTGNVSRSARTDIFRNFRECQDPRIIVAHPGTMAHGLDLTTASTTIWFGPPDDAEVYQQANKRMDRPGQQNSMLMVRISSTPVEREIYKRLDEKQGLQGLMLDLIQGVEL
jgi:SNF2 family DNA or RNA helicase